MTSHDGQSATQQALIKATLALDRLARHEQACDARWHLVIRLLWAVMTKLGALLLFLLADKMEWIP